jgi:excisionase family DNA binding protein
MSAAVMPLSLCTCEKCQKSRHKEQQRLIRIEAATREEALRQLRAPDLPDALAVRTDTLADLMEIGRSTAYRLVQNGEIDSSRVGSERRVLVADAIAYLRRRMVGER